MTDLKKLPDIEKELSKDKYFEMPNVDKKIEKLEKKYEGLGNKIKAEKFIGNVNDNKFLKDNKVKAVSSSSHTFFKAMTILFFVFIISLTGFLIYVGYTGGFDNLISPIFNNTVNIDNEFNNEFNNEFDNTINNDYEHNIDNNITIINNILIPNGS